MSVRKIALAAVVALSAGPALAHHSASMFDASKVIEVSGTVKAWEFVNPHSWLQVVVADPGGKEAQWSFEGGRPGSGGDSPNAALRKDTFKPGDKVLVRTHPMRDGRSAGSLEEVVFADGHKWTMPSFAAAQAPKP